MKRSAAILILTTATVLGGCDTYKESQGTADAPIYRTERDGWVVMSSPDQFPNIAFRCMGPNGIYNPRLANADSARYVTVIPNDPQCTP